MTETVSDVPTEAPPRISLEAVSKHFGGVQALDGVSVNIRRGTVHALVGENGAGKSTLGKLIAGIYRPDHGTIRADGVLGQWRSPREARAAGITTVAQEISLVPYLSVLQNVYLGVEQSTLGVIRSSVQRRSFAELCAEFNFSLPADQRVEELKVADQQKVEILRAAARGCDCIVLDEPTAALGAADVQALLRAVKHLRAQGITVVYVSHFLNEVLEVADDITIMRDGKLVRTATARDETVESLVHSMLGRSITSAENEIPVLPSPQAQPVLEVRNLRARGCGPIDVTVKAGEVVGIGGLVGSGRSSLARALFGVTKRETGRVLVSGRIVRGGERAAIDAGIHLIPEDRKTLGLHLDRTVDQNISLPHPKTVSRYGFLSRRREKSVVAPLTKRLGIRESARLQETAVRLLSGGNQQRVLFAKWLAVKPQVLIVDEPTRGVDVGSKAAIYDFIREIAEAGTAVILISSENDELVRLASRVLVLRGGRVQRELIRGEIDEQSILSAAFGSRATGAENVETT